MTVSRFEASIESMLPELAALAPLWNELSAAGSNPVARRLVRRIALLLTAVGQAHYSLLSKGSPGSLQFCSLVTISVCCTGTSHDVTHTRTMPSSSNPILSCCINFVRVCVCVCPA